MISTHTLTWSVTVSSRLRCRTFRNFNSHAHVERDVERLIKMKNKWDFNSHAHVERDLRCRTDSPFVQISTHTLTWSVTVTFTAEEIERSISTHTLTWSVTGNIMLDMLDTRISTHTLTWSVTFGFLG